MDPTFADMERKRQTMITSFTAVAKAMTACAKAVNDFALHAPAQLGVNLPTINMAAVQPAPAAATPAAAPTAKARKNAAPVDNPAAVAAAVPSFSVADATAATAPTAPKRGRKVTKEKKIKDPLAPKRPPSAYLLFQNEVRDEMKAKLGEDAQYKDVIAAIAARWKEMTAEEKKEYAGAYALANTEYKLQEAEYQSGPAEAFAAQQAAAAGTPSTEDSSSEDSDDSSDEDDAVPVKPAPAPVSAPVYQAPAPPPPAPKGSLGAAVAAVSGTSEKKHKKTQDNGEGPEKKKKKKSKTVEA